MIEKSRVEVVRLWATFERELPGILFSDSNFRKSQIEMKLAELVERSRMWAGDFVKQTYNYRLKLTNEKLKKLYFNPKNGLRHSRYIESHAKRFYRFFDQMAKKIMKVVDLYFEIEAETDMKLSAAASFYQKVEFRKTDVGKEVDKKAKQALTVIRRFTRDGYMYRAIESKGQLKKKIKQLYFDLFGEIDFIEIRMKNGRTRRYKPKTYIEMVTRTEMRYIQTRATVNTCQENSCDLVRFSSHFNSCPVCEPFQGQIFSLSGRSKEYPKLVESPPLHPHCEHILDPTTEVALFIEEKHGKRPPDPLPSGYTVEKRRAELRKLKEAA